MKKSDSSTPNKNRIKNKASWFFRKGWVMALLLTIFVFLLVFLFFLFFSTKAPRYHEEYGEKIKSDLITEQMTLMDVEKETGISAKKIADILDLPPEISLNETIKALGERCDFNLQDVKDVLIEQLKKEQELKVKEKMSTEEPFHQESRERLVRGRMASVPSGILITGQMSLYDLEDITGIPAREIADELGIPSNAPLNEHLGRLRKRYFFSMQDVKNVVADLMKKERRKK